MRPHQEKAAQYAAGYGMKDQGLAYGGSVTGRMAGRVSTPGYQTFPRSNKRDPYMASIVERLGRYITAIQVMGKGYRPGYSKTGEEVQYPYEIVAVLHMDRIRPAPPRLPLGPTSRAVAANNVGVLRVVWESDQVPAGGKTLKSRKGQALARAREEMRLAHIKEA